MTYIKKMRLRGFKSFASPIDLEFGKNFNCILGPNGSGKSLCYDSVVTLSNGKEIKIGDLIENKLNSAKIIKKLKDGIYCESSSPVRVISLNKDSMKEEEIEVSKFIKREGEPYLYEITTRTGKKVKATGSDNSIFIGGKPFMNYITAVVMQFRTKGAEEVIVKARGKFISRAVDVAEVSSKRFLEGTVEVSEIKVDSEEFKNKEGKDVRVSSIEIILRKE